MESRRFDVSPIVVAKARAAGPAGERWLRDLSETVAVLEAAWNIRVQSQLTAGTASFVARAVTGTGQDVVVKIALPDVGLEQEARTLAAAAGNGYVRLLAVDLARYAVLLEPLGPSLDRSGLSPVDQLAVLGALLKVAWRVSPDLDDQPIDKAAHLTTAILAFQQHLSGAVEKEVVEYAVACARRRSADLDERRCVRLHGDPTPVNTLKTLRPRPGAVRDFVLIDPSSFIGDPAYDAGVALRDWSPQLLSAPDPRGLLHAYTDGLAAVTGLDPVAIWEWAFIERVTTGLYCLSLGQEDLGRPFLTSAASLLPKV